MEYKFTNNSFDLYKDEKIVAHIGFTMIDDNQTYVVETTFVNDDYRGQGIAGKITKEFLKHVENQNQQVLALCPFTVEFLKRHPEYQKLVKNSEE